MFVRMNQDDNLLRELNFLVYRFLENSDCPDALSAWRSHLDTNNESLLPRQYQWNTGRPRPTNIDEIERRLQHVPREYLFSALKNCARALDHVSPKNELVKSHSHLSFVGTGRSSLLRHFADATKNYSPPLLHKLVHYPNHVPQVVPIQFPQFYPPNVVATLMARKVGGARPLHHLLPSSHYQNYKKHRRLLGHLSSVYCLTFDRTGRFIVTGADDKLVKIWSAVDGRLLMTLRGHSEEISDLTIDPENTMIASSSCDKTVRVWCLKNASPITVLSGHSGYINNLNFCPLLKWEDKRYLVSTGNDGCICFWAYNPKTKEFKSEPIKYQERKKSTSHIMYSTFSNGGEFMAMGSSDNHLYVFHIGAPNVPTKIFETDAHLSDVDSIMFSNHSMRFVSGGKDGIALIWRYEKQTWKHIKLRMDEKLAGSGETVNIVDNKRNSTGLRVSMVCWTCDDANVITSVNDNTIKVWDSFTGELKNILYGHEQEVFVIEAHPIDPRIFLSGGHEGAINLWDVVTGQNIQTLFNAIEGQGHGAIFDCKWSPDGSMFASTDSHGHITFFGLGPSDQYQKMPEHAFFHTDYRPLTYDRGHYALDDQNQIAPHLMSPPFLVDIDGNPYNPDIQRLVPGRENFSDNQLVPYVANSFEMEAEPMNEDAQPQQPEAAQPAPTPTPTPQPSQPQLQAHPSHSEVATTTATTPADPSSVLDERIRQIIRQQEGEPTTQASVQADDHRDHQNRNVSNRRNGDVEGVRQSANFVTRGNQHVRSVWQRRVLVPPLDDGAWAAVKKRLMKLGEDEAEHFEVERKKRPDIEEIVTIREQPIVTRRRQRITFQSHGVIGSTQVELDDDEMDQDFVARSSSSSSEEEEEEEGLFDSDDTTDSDYAPRSSNARARPTERQQQRESMPETITASGRRSRRVINSSGDENQTTPTSRDHQRSKSKKKRKTTRHSRSANNNNNEEEDDDASTAAAARAAQDLRREQLRILREENRQRQINRQLHSEVSELPESFRPPEWITDTKPKRTPYFPQSGDEVIYFRTGHQQYIDKVREGGLYPMNSNIKPFKIRGSDSDEYFARILDVQFSLKLNGIRLVRLTLNVIDPHAENPETNYQFKVSYHDVENVVDFIILKEIYDQSISREWKNGDDFRSVIDDKWWTGKIIAINQSEPHTFFQCFRVEWSNGDEENLSPWDLEPTKRSKRPTTSSDGANDGVPLNNEEKSNFNSFNDLEITQDERQRLIDGFIRIMQFSQSELFTCPVDLNENPLYGMAIPYPIDLSTIKSRIENRFYRRKDAIKFDADFIFKNAESYNEPGSEIVLKANIVSNVCKRFIEDINCFDPTPILIEVQAELNSRRSTRSSHGSATDIGSDSNSEEQRTTRSNRVVKKPTRYSDNSESEEDLKIKSWKQNCRELLDYMFSLADSEPFRRAVDPLVYPEYSNVIDTPMDLTLVKEELIAGNYRSSKEFCKDMRLIFNNSKLFNINKKSQIYSMTIRLSTLFEEKFRKIASDAQATKRIRARGYVSKRTLPLNHFRLSSGSEPSSSRPGPSRSSRGRVLNSSSSFADEPGSSRRVMSRQRPTSKRSHSDEDSSPNGGASHRSKKPRRFYKEEETDEESEVETKPMKKTSRSSGSASSSVGNGGTVTNGTSQSNSRRSQLPKRKNKSETEDDFDDEEEEVLPKKKDIIRTKSGRVVKPKLNESDQEEEEENEDSETEEDDDEDEDDDGETEDEEEGTRNDSDATQVDEDEGTDKENDVEDTSFMPRRSTRKPRPECQNEDSRSSIDSASGSGTRRSRRKIQQLNYDESDDEVMPTHGTKSRGRKPGAATDCLREELNTDVNQKIRSVGGRNARRGINCR